MENNKLTDSEIVKALECCVNEKTCKNCAYNGRPCMTPLKRDALNLINRKDKEINRLQARVELLDTELGIKELEYSMLERERAEDIGKFAEELKTIKAEAYKEFADKIYEKVDFYINETNDTLNKMLLGKMQGTLSRKHYLYGGLSVLYEINSMLNILLKELVDNNG